MPRTREEILQARRQLREKYRNLYDATIALLFRHDPVGINFEDNTDEYAPEAGTILPKLQSCRSAMTLWKWFTARFFAGSATPLARRSTMNKSLASCGSFRKGI